MTTNRTVSKRILGRGGLHVFLIAVTVPLVFPFIWMAAAAIKQPAEVFDGAFKLIPMHPAWSNLRQVFTFQPFARQMYNSLYIALIVAALTCVLSLLAAYAFARLQFPGRNLLFLVFLGALMMPDEVTVIPNFTFMKSLGLVDTHVPLLVLPLFGATGVTGIFLMRQFLQALPHEVEEAAMLDGLGRLGILRRVVLPLSRPMLATIGIIAFLSSWNSFLNPLIFLNRRELFTIPLALTSYTDTGGTPIWNLQMAATALSTLPMLIVYLLARRQITDSLAQSGLR